MADDSQQADDHREQSPAEQPSADAAPNDEAQAEHSPDVETGEPAPEPAPQQPDDSGKPAPEPAPQQGGDRRGDNGQQARLVCVRYGRMGALGLFRSKAEDIPARTRVVVKSDRGLELGVALCPATKDTCYEGKPLKRVGSLRRLATDDDLMEERHLRRSEERERDFCRQKIKERDLPMTLAAAEHLFGGDRIVFYFLAEGRVDFRDLVKDLAHEYQTRIEMRQIGVRDEARLLADYERCGQPICCRTFIKEFQPVSMRMAKLQKATLDPSKISGRCGRLMCCLRYEFDTYEELRKKLPKKNSYVMTEFGPGKVVGSDILTQLCKVAVADKVRIVPVEEITARDLTEDDVANWKPSVGRGAGRDPTKGDRGRRRRTPRPDRSAESRKAAEAPAPADTPQAAPAGGAAADGQGDQSGGGQPSRKTGRRPRRRRRKKRSSAAAQDQGQVSQSGGQQQPTSQPRQDAPPDRQPRPADRAPAKGQAADRGLGVPKKVLESLGIEGGGEQDSGGGGKQGESAADKQGESAADKPQTSRRRSHRGRRRSKRKREADRSRDRKPPEDGSTGDSAGERQS